jgi:hypothetical protein
MNSHWMSVNGRKQNLNLCGNWQSAQQHVRSGRSRRRNACFTLNAANEQRQMNKPVFGDAHE